jgi:hypothetical protein
MEGAMTVGERLWEKVRGLRGVWEGIARAEDDLLRQFKDQVEFIDWFKALADPVLQLHYEIGYQWGSPPTWRASGPGSGRGFGTCGPRRPTWRE